MSSFGRCGRLPCSRPDGCAELSPRGRLGAPVERAVGSFPELVGRLAVLSGEVSLCICLLSVFSLEFATVAFWSFPTMCSGCVWEACGSWAFPPLCPWSLQPGAGSFTERRFSVLTKSTFSALSSCAQALREVQTLLSKPSSWERFSAAATVVGDFFSLAHQGWVIPVDCRAPNSLWFRAPRCWAGGGVVPCAAVSARRGVSEALGRLWCPTCSVLAPQRAGV